uniref:50S ribosomal protein L11 methyltransferase n=1 Tax=Loa loa TaxID=7209 RepID=A0A1I7V8C0_LOALO
MQNFIEHSILNEYSGHYIEDYTLLDELDIPKDQVKLVIVIASGPKSINEDAESKTLNVTEEIRKEVDSAPICVVAQSDNQHEA